MNDQLLKAEKFILHKEQKFMEEMKEKDNIVIELQSRLKKLSSAYDEDISILNDKLNEFNERLEEFKTKEKEMDFICQKLQSEKEDMEKDLLKKLKSQENKLNYYVSLNNANEIVKSDEKIIGKLKEIITQKDEVISRLQKDIQEFDSLKKDCFDLIEKVDF